MKPLAPRPYDSFRSGTRLGVISSKPQVGGNFSCGSSSNQKPNPQQDKGKEVARDLSRTPLPEICFRCWGRGHKGAQCPSKRNALYLEDTKEDDSTPGEEKSHVEHEDGTPREEDLDGDSAYLAYLGKAVEHSSDHHEVPLWVVRCALTTPKQEDDWRRTNIFYTYAKSGEKICKLIVDSGNYTNVVSTRTIKWLRLKPVPHPRPYKVAWVNATSIPVSYRCQAPIELYSYKDTLWCDVVTMDVGYIILGRPWLYDLDVTLYGKPNTYAFKF